MCSFLQKDLPKLVLTEKSEIIDIIGMNCETEKTSTSSNGQGIELATILKKINNFTNLHVRNPLSSFL